MTEFTTGLPRDPTSVPAARRLVAAHATGLSDTKLEDACLMVSELITNALVHGTGAMLADGWGANEGSTRVWFELVPERAS